MDKETQKKILPLRIVVGILSVIFILSLVKIAQIANDYRSSHDIYDAANETYVTGQDAGTYPEWYQLISVDLEGLQAENPEIAGWIWFENEPAVSYPVLYSTDNKKYLKTAWNGQPAVAGSIFMERSNNPDFSDPHTIIYGHNMRDLSMFGRLKLYKNDADYYPEHQFFQIITNNMYYRYTIIACREVSVRDNIYTVWKEGGVDFAIFIDESILKDSLIQADYTTVPQDHIITLSVCSSNNRRLTVSAVRSGEQPRL